MKDQSMLDNYSIVPTIVPYTSCFQDTESEFHSTVVTSTLYGITYSPCFMLLYAIQDTKTYYSILV